MEKYIDTPEVDLSVLDSSKFGNKCANCAYCEVVNSANIYAVCSKNGWVFRSFEQDTRDSYCNFFIKKPKTL